MDRIKNFIDKIKNKKNEALKSAKMIVLLLKKKGKLSKEEAEMLEFPYCWIHHPDIKKIKKDASTAWHPIYYKYKSLSTYCKALENGFDAYKEMPKKLLEDIDRYGYSEFLIKNRHLSIVLNKDVYFFYVLNRFSYYLKKEKNPNIKDIKKALNAFVRLLGFLNIKLSWTNDIDIASKNVLKNSQNISHVINILSQ